MIDEKIQACLRYVGPLGIILLLAGALWAGDDAALDKTIRALDGVFLRDDKAQGKPIVEISFSQSKKLKDADMKLVGTLTKLRFLSLDDTQITDVGLKELAGLTEMKGL